MSYKDTLDFVHQIPRMSKDLNLKKVSQLLDLIGNPQNDLKFVHVAGTNGKGSTCTMLSNVLTKTGYKAGLYISPFVIDFRERFQINNEMISEADFTQITNYIKPFWQQMTDQGNMPSQFELTVAIAFEFFKRQKCDIVVLEVGMGGRLDATNVISTPLVSVITSISRDHIKELGYSLESIASEKAGIIKENGVTVVYPLQQKEVLNVLKSKVKEENNSLIIPSECEILEENLNGNTFIYKGDKYHVSLIGEHQVYNALTVIEVCKVLKGKGFNLSYEIVYNGINNTSFAARIEILSTEPLIIVDGAHNLSGAEKLAEALNLLGNKRIHGIMGMLSSKDVDGVIKQIAPHLSSITTTQDPNNNEFMNPKELMEKFAIYNIQSNNNQDPQKALRFVLDKAEKDDVILVFGSLYLASVLRGHILQLKGG